MTDEKVKRPASQYYWGEFLNDKALQSCGLMARGLWHEMNCLMHQGEPYGHLTVNGKAMTIPKLANLCRVSAAKCKALVDELDDAGVFSRDEATGAIYSRRMVRDERVREARAAGGKGGAEHGIKGAEHGAKGGRPATHEGGLETPLSTEQKPPPSSSSASSSASSVQGIGREGVSPDDNPPPPDLLGDEDPEGIPPCDHQAVLKLWAQLVPTNPQPKKWTPARQGHLRARWRELFVEGKAKTRDDALAWFAKYFRWVAQSQFLTGRGKARQGMPPFEARLDWVLIPDNLAKTLEGEYHRED